MPEVLAHPDAESDVTLHRRTAKSGSGGANRVARGEEASFIEDSVRRQITLACNMAHLSPLQECGGGE